jgi:hypothetical protein
MQRGFDYTAERAAASFLEIVCDLGMVPFDADRTAIAASTT